MCIRPRVRLRRMFHLACTVALALAVGQGVLRAQQYFPLKTQEKKTADDAALPPWKERGLRSALADPSPEVRAHAVEYIAGTRWATTLLTPQDVQPLLHSTDEKIRMRAAKALGTQAATDAKELLPLLHSQDVQVILRALDVMQSLGRAASPCIKELLPLLQSPDEAVRGQAAKTLASLGPDAIPYAKELLPLLRDERSVFIGDAAEALGLLGRVDAAAIVPLLLQHLTPEPAPRRTSAAASPPAAPAGDPFAAPPASQPAAPTGDPFGAPPTPQPAAPTGDPFGAPPTSQPAEPKKDPAGTASAPATAEEKKEAAPASASAPAVAAEPPPTTRPMRAAWPKDKIVHTLGTMGAAAVPLAAPALAQLLTDQDSLTPRAAELALSRLGYEAPAAMAQALLPILKASPDDPNLEKILQILGDLDTEVAPLVLPALLPLLQPQAGAAAASFPLDHAVEALGWLSRHSDPAVVDALLPLLTSPDASMRYYAAYALRHAGRQARPRVVSALLPLVKDADKRVRASAIDSLVSAGRNIVPKEITDALRSMLKDPSSSVRDSAASELHYLREHGHAFMGDTVSLSDLQRRLPDMLKHAAPEVLARATEALAQAAEDTPVSPEIVHAILPLLTDTDFSVRVSILDALVLVPPGTADAPQIVSALKPLLKEPEARLRVAAAVILQRQGLDAITCIRAVKPLLKSSSILDQENALGAYAALAHALPAREVVPALIPMLKIPYQVVCLTAAEILQRLGPKIDPYAEEILALFHHPSKNVKWAACMALAHAGPDTAPRVFRALRTWIKTDPEMQMLAVNMLGDMGPAAAPKALPLLVPLLHLKEDRSLSCRVAIALGRMGPAAAPAAKDLATVLDNIDPTWGYSGQDPQYPAAEALGQLGPGVAPIALPALLACFEKDDALLSYHASAALQSLGPQLMPAMLSTEMARWHKAGAPPASSWSLGDIDRWGNRSSDPACHCAALAALLEFAGSAPAQRLRFHLHLWSGHSEELLLSVRWLGKPAATPMPANGAALSAAEQQAVLHMLHTLWPHSTSYPALRQEMAARIADVAQSITTAPDEKTAALLMSIDEQLKADTVKETQPASAKARAALEQALAVKPAAQ